jgi:predicted dehydrogenase
MTTEVIDIGVDTVRTGLVGGGFMGRVHAAAARRAGAQLTAVASSSRGRAEAVARELGVARVEDDAAGVFAASDVDVVHICTPNATHAPLAAAALAAGKHVVCEKPLATTVADARALARAAKDAGVVAAVPFVYRYHPMVREARARVASGRIGTLLTLDGSYLQDWMLRQNDDDWRADAATGGPSRAFADIGSHLCDLVEFVAALLVETDSGALGTLLVSQMAPGRKNALVIELHGSRRSLRFDQERPEELWIGARKGSRLMLRDPATADPDAARLQRVPAGHPMGYQDAFDGFVADVYSAIAGQAPDGLPTFADGLRAAVLTDAVLEAAHSQSWIEVTS